MELIFSNSDESIFDLTSGFEPYGTMLLFHYIYENYGGVIHDFTEAFAYMCASNYDTRTFYTRSSNFSKWGPPTVNSLEVGIKKGNQYVNPMACAYWMFTNNAGVSGNILCRVKTYSTSDTLTIAPLMETGNGEVKKGNRIFRNYSGITINTPDLGGETYKNIILVPVNTNTSGDAIKYYTQSEVDTD